MEIWQRCAFRLGNSPEVNSITRYRKHYPWIFCVFIETAWNHQQFLSFFDVYFISPWFPYRQFNWIPCLILFKHPFFQENQTSCSSIFVTFDRLSVVNASHRIRNEISPISKMRAIWAGVAKTTAVVPYTGYAVFLLR